MLKRFLRLRVSVPVAALAVAAGVYSLISAADYTPAAYLDTQTFMVTWHMVRVGASNISCTGVCRTAQASAANPATCRVNEPAQTSTTNCLTQLNTDCTPQNVLNCVSGERL